MMNTILLQAVNSTNVNDITFRTMDVVLIVGGVISVLTSFFVLRFQSISTAKDLAAYIAANEKTNAQFGKELDKIGEVHGDFKEKIFKKMDEQNTQLHDLGINIEKFKTEIIQQLNKK